MSDNMTTATIELRDETMPYKSSPVLTLQGPWLEETITLRMGDAEIRIAHKRLVEALKRLAP